MILLPGPSTTFTLAVAVARGRTAGSATSLGIGTGSLFHAIAASLGLSALLATSAIAFALIKYVGAAYLVYLGIKLLLSRSEPSIDLTTDQSLQEGGWSAYRQGLFTEVLNPKSAIFFLSFLPQFIHPAVPMAQLGLLVLGVTFASIGALWCLLLAWMAGFISQRLRRNTTARQLLNRATGAVLIALGAKLASEKA